MFIWFLFAATLAAAPAPETAPGPTRNVTVDVQVASVAADSVTLLWSFALADRWHLYGPFRNDTGLAPRIELELPPGWSADAPRWPAPERNVLAGEILDHVYHDRLFLPQTLRRPTGAPARDAHARIAWLACDEICVPGDTTVTLTIGDRADPAAAPELVDALAALPRPFAGDVVRIERIATEAVITVPGASSLTLIPAADGPPLVDLVADGRQTGDRLRLRFRPHAGPPQPLRALLIIDRENGDSETGTIVIPVVATAQ